MLSRIYERYGVRLRAVNGRAGLSLQARKSGNAEPTRTIIEQPTRFRAFNNRMLASVDDSEPSAQRDGAATIHVLKGLQIVTGGQTPASLHRARRKESANLGHVSVPIKIIKVGGADLAEMV